MAIFSKAFLVFEDLVTFFEGCRVSDLGLIEGTREEKMGKLIHIKIYRYGYLDMISCLYSNM